jgi:hypothetical protein
MQIENDYDKEVYNGDIGTSSTPASPGGSGSSYWLDKRRHIAVRNASGRRRWSKLAEWLRRGLLVSWQ